MLARKAGKQTPEARAETQPSTAGNGVTAWRFRLTVLKYDRLVYRFARALLRDEREAEDVTQEAFLRYWEQGSTVQQPRQWLLTVARNNCLDRLRKSGRFVAEAQTPPPELREERDPAWHYQHDELAARLQRLVVTLPEPQRSLIVLFDMQGLDGRACAEILGLSPNQVKVYLHRARRRLRLKLDGVT